MNKLALALAAGFVALSAPMTPAFATFETEAAKMAALGAAETARMDMQDKFGKKVLKPGQYLWAADAPTTGESRVVVSLSDQMAYLYRGNELAAVSTISSGTDKNPTPTGIFPILEKKTMHRSRKYDNAPMPFMQRLDKWGIALHAGALPGYAASHGCIRLPAKFAQKLFSTTGVGDHVMIAA
ncbi:L,D-transpeptidase family protein [Sphingomonas sp. LY29]|uniref:L,D-transpeptidase family protein n=1 Tax=Sphingomonas sp. LY29 TaxID=3095341 RepID=UPI002D768310|nr:L,D-transpeptidase family protein [Sphingomonas sp. LY29]WRP25167.1 L,D-transpeptidase family protein [Sphingomonas sp. LY29]